MNIPKLNSRDTSKFMTEHNDLVSKKEKSPARMKRSAADSFEYSGGVSFSEEGYGKYRKSVYDTDNKGGSEHSPLTMEEERNALDAADEKDPAESAGKQEEQTGQKESAGDRTGTSGCVSINVGKLARMLAAAKTRSQVQAVIAKIQADLMECEAGKNNGMDVDEASVKAAEQLLVEAKFRMSSAEDREATPEEEMAAALASFM